MLLLVELASKGELSNCCDNPLLRVTIHASGFDRSLSSCNRCPSLFRSERTR